ncbi:ABC transporter substrate-binding protein SapA [Vibrio sp. MA40-2]|uniref:ABC transporter substrate-binding protein SapA n=1 Tax=Vibrio sp. MA40-2 TaxID=3391828 RepID=UPI0039A5D6DA
MKAILKFTASIMGLGLLAGCDNSIDHSTIRKQGFVSCGHSSPDSFNPQIVEGGFTDESLSPQIYDSLLTLDPTSLKPITNIASSWTVDRDGTVYTFKLRHDVEFQTTAWFTPTRPLDASDVVFSFSRIIDSTNSYHDIGDASYPWFESIDFSNLLQKVEALDSHTVQFTLSTADNTFLSNIATTHAVILSREYAQQLEKSGQKQRIDEQPVGTGPFYLSEYQVGDLVRLKRHQKYWQGTPDLEQVVFDISSRGTGPLAKLLRRECDVLYAPLSSQIPIIKQDENLVLEAKPSMNVSFIAINTDHPALNDPRVRKALSLSINRKSILDSVYYGTGEQAYSLLPPSSWAYENDSNQIRFDKNYALGLLKEAGYMTGLQLSMWVPLEATPFNPSPRKTAELIQSNYADIGIELELFTSDRFNRTDLNTHASMDLILTGWNASTGDPDNFLRPLLSCSAEQSGLNVSMWCNPDFDFLLDLAKETNQERYRLNLYKEAQYIMNEEVPIIPLAHGAQFLAYHESLQGFESSPFSTQSFHKVRRVK